MERLERDNYYLSKELDRRGDPSLNPCEGLEQRIYQLEAQLAERDEALAAFRAFARAYVVWRAFRYSPDFTYPRDKEIRQGLNDARAAVERWMGEW